MVELYECDKEVFFITVLDGDDLNWREFFQGSMDWMLAVQCGLEGFISQMVVCRLDARRQLDNAHALQL